MPKAFATASGAQGQCLRNRPGCDGLGYLDLIWLEGLADV